MDLQLSSALIKRSIYLIIVTSAVFVTQHYCHFSQPFWLIVPAFTLALITSGNTFLSRFTLILLTGLSALILALLAAWLGFSVLLLSLFLCLVTVICTYLGQCYPAYFFPAFLVNLFAILANAMDTPHAQGIGLPMLVGLMIALLPQLLFWPYYQRDELQFNIVKALHYLRMLNRELFACFLQPDYADNIYLYERRIHEQKNKFLQTILKLRSLVAIKEKMTPPTILAKLDLIYDTVLDYGQLRRRVTDFTLFAVCSRELLALSQAIDQALTLKPSVQANAKLLAAINQFQAINQNVLQVTAREPLALILFIASLTALRDEIQELHAILQQEAGGQRVD